jgi:hypothetical protein
VCGKDYKSFVSGVGKGKHLILCLGAGILFGVEQAGGVPMMAVGYDAALVAHHFGDGVNIVSVGYGEQTVADAVLVNEINQGFLLCGTFDNLVCEALLVVVKHEDQAEAGRRGEIEPVNGGLVHDLFMGPDGPAELFEPAQSNESQTLEAPAEGLKILDVAVYRFLGILLERPVIYPVAQILGGPGVLVVAAGIRRLGLAFYYPYDVVSTLPVELLLLVGVDNVVWRSDAATDVADHTFIKPECPERPNFHRAPA